MANDKDKDKNQPIPAPEPVEPVPVPPDPVPEGTDPDKMEMARRGELSATQVSDHSDENDVISPAGYVETVSRTFPGASVVK